MTSDELLKAINDAKSQMTLWQSIHGSPGYAHQLELLKRLKTEEMLRKLACDLLGWDGVKLSEMLATLDNQLLLGDQIAASTDSRVALIDKFEAHPNMVWAVARFLG